MTKEDLATGLGWFSIGLGVAELVAPGAVSRFIGIAEEDEESHLLMRLYGIREIAAGVGILSQPQPAGWLWSRFAGDLMDLSTLGAAMASEDNDRGRLIAATAAVVGVTALDIYCAQQMSESSGSEPGVAGPKKKSSQMVQAVNTIIINKPPEEVYSFYRDFERLSTFMKNIESVTVTGDRTSHWVASGPGGIRVEWDAETTEDRHGEFLGWRSLPGSDLHLSGAVRFQPATGGRGTLLRIEMQYAPPGGKISSKLAKLVGQDPSQQMQEDLRRLKQVLETGEVMASDASVHRGMHPAQPSERVDDLALAPV